jgi:hypothetical protein
MPFGRPITNAQLYVLDPYLHLVPVEVAGELYIGGGALARGYLGRQNLTAERFIPNPFSTKPGERLYRTGDRVRYLPDGTLQFLGRFDHQVKLRGFRIELGEIETVLKEHPAVRNTVVLVRGESAGEHRLIAYVVPDQKPAIDSEERARFPNLRPDELRTFLRERLPDYMVPAAIVLLDTLPLTPNGKLDQRALLASPVLTSEQGDTYVQPKTEIERTIAVVWQEVLQVEQIGMYNNFFDLGGHSLLMIQVQSKLKDALQQDILIVDLFKYPTIRSLAEYLSNSQDIQPDRQQIHERANKVQKALRTRKRPQNN